MKNAKLISTAMLALTVSADLWAQTRGPHYNPSPSRGSSSGSSHSSPSHSSSSSHGPSYHPSPSRPSSSSSSSSSRGPSYHPTPTGPSRPSSSSSSSSPRGPSYNPPSSSSTPGPSYNPPRSTPVEPSRPTPVPRGPSYNPTPGHDTNTNVPHGPSYNPNPGATRINPPRHQAGQIFVRREITHVPYRIENGTVIYHVPREYWMHVNRHYIFRRWIQEPVRYTYYNGYWDIDGYPYYVHRGFRYRYSPVDQCQYDLVDGDTYTTVKTFDLKACSIAYDECATERDTMNHNIGMERYFCAESVDQDLSNQNDTDYTSSPVEMNDAKKAAIASYLEGKSYQDIFDDAYYNWINDCNIVKVRGDENGCRYYAKIDDDVYPQEDALVCSESEQAALVGCNVGTEQENAGCIMKKAIEEGYCQ